MTKLRAALDRLEDSKHFDSVHREIDHAGRVQRVFFPKQCELKMEGTTYTQECPVALSHVRIGMSIGGIIREAECSICGADPEDCVHIAGRSYDGQACYRIIKRFDLEHVAFVERPDFPDARIMAQPVSTADLIANFGPRFVPGLAITCDRCLNRCNGVTRPAQH